VIYSTLVRRLRRILNMLLLAEQGADLLRLRDLEIEELQRVALAANRSSLDLAVAFRVALEQPEVDIRADLDALIDNLSNQVAQIEEHVL